MTSTRRQYAQVARHIIAADIIQYYIHAASLGFFKDNRDEIFAVTINGAPYAKLSQRLILFVPPAVAITRAPHACAH